MAKPRLPLDEQRAKEFDDAIKGHLCSACRRRTTEWSKRACCFGAVPGGKYCPPSMSRR